MRKLAIFLLLSLLLATAVSAAADEVSTLTADVTVREDGTCLVTATAVIDFGTAPTSFSFPLGSGASDITATGGSYETEREDGVRYLVFSNSAGFTGRQTFTCTYELPCLVEDTALGQQFSLLLPERGWEYPINKLTLHITFPTAPDGLPAWTSAYYGDVIDNYLRVQLEDASLTATSTQAFKDHETLSMQIQFADSSFDLRHLPGKTAVVDKPLFFLLLLAAGVYWFLFLRGRLLLPKSQRTTVSEATAGEIPSQLFGDAPDLATTLADWGNLGYLSVHRDRRGRISLRKEMEMGSERKSAERKLFNTVFRHADTVDAQETTRRAAVKEASHALRATWLHRIYRKRSGSPRLLRLLGLLASVPVGVLAADLLLPAQGMRWFLLPLLALLILALSFLLQRGAGALLHRRRVLPLLLALASAVGLLLFGSSAGCSGYLFLNLLLQIFCALATLFGGRRTAVGEELVRQLLGLRAYLRKADGEALARLVQNDGQYFYRILPHAEQLGVARSFAKRFGDLRMEPCGWLTDDITTPKTAAEFYALYADIFSVLRGELSLRAVSPAPQQAKSTY